MASRAGIVKQQFFDDNGDPLAGGLLYTYEAGSTTPRVTYADKDEFAQNSNPIELDARGECDIWLTTGSYKFILCDANDVPIYTEDNIQSFAAQINLSGALSIVNNLSDVASASASLVNLGIAPFSTPYTHSFTNNQAATNLTGRAYSSSTYRAVFLSIFILRGAVASIQQFALVWDGSAWALQDLGDSGSGHGLTFSLSGTTTAQLRLASDNSGSSGNVYIKEHYWLA
jgi:hypothetical protein